jgi:hypothetical protein
VNLIRIPSCTSQGRKSSRTAGQAHIYSSLTNPSRVAERDASDAPHSFQQLHCSAPLQCIGWETSLAARVRSVGA